MLTMPPASRKHAKVRQRPSSTVTKGKKKPLKHSNELDEKAQEYHLRKQKTYNSGYLLVVTHLTTNPPVRCLNRAERTGSLAVSWSLTTKILNSTVSGVAAAENSPQRTQICNSLHAPVARNRLDPTAAFVGLAIYRGHDPNVRPSHAASATSRGDERNMRGALPFTPFSNPTFYTSLSCWPLRITQGYIVTIRTQLS
ncbi:hypothetical protein BU25DRAFT_130876 [Macroventuria anomochaeta]|uniref:Uncharacterized protein n=1 Tax=Macroventuria anomochaeta TaxID=301207 RepID=A0ACB6RUR6_9PLEO|nr:hypothetical protein BU25DRAFT_130876 [Macroventuria anomochaeta]